MSPAPSPAFSLLLACCRWPSSRNAIVAASVGVDWDRFLRLAIRHRVEGLAYRALVAADVAPPEPIRRALSDAASVIAQQNLKLAAESIQLDRLLEGAGVSPLFVKGVTLGKLAYGDIARKAGWDIDLLVAPANLEAAAAVLAKRGYVVTTPATDDPRRDLPQWHRYEKESVWHDAGRAIWVELHTALTNDALLLPTVGAGSPRRAVAVSPGLSLPTLDRDELFAYLCVHGASSMWFRLKWIADLAAIIAVENAEEIERLYRRSVELGAGRSAALALLLADALFGLPIGLDLRRELGRDRQTRWLVAIARRKLMGRAGEVELDTVALGTASIHAAQLLLLPGWRPKRSALARLLVNPVDRIARPLPALLAWLYPLRQAVRLRRGRTID